MSDKSEWCSLVERSVGSLDSDGTEVLSSAPTDKHELRHNTARCNVQSLYGSRKPSRESMNMSVTPDRCFVHDSGEHLEPDLTVAHHYMLDGH